MQGFECSDRDGVLLLSLDRPPLNTLDAGFFEAMATLVGRLAAQADASGTPAWRALVIQGRGKHFSAGADLREMGRLLKGRTEEPDFLRQNSQALDQLSALPFPSIAAISGCCLGAGLELALACRHRLLADNAMLGFPESGFGIIPGCGGTVRAARRLGPSLAADLILSGRYLDAREALSLGLADAVVPRRELTVQAFRLVELLSPPGPRP